LVFLGLFFVLVFGLVFPARLFFVPVHVRKRGPRMKAATAAQFFIARSGTVKIARSC
jgi:hypothetical protein